MGPFFLPDVSRAKAAAVGTVLRGAELLPLIAVPGFVKGALRVDVSDLAAMGLPAADMGRYELPARAEEAGCLELSWPGGLRHSRAPQRSLEFGNISTTSGSTLILEALESDALSTSISAVCLSAVKRPLGGRDLERGAAEALGLRGGEAMSEEAEAGEKERSWGTAILPIKLSRLDL